MNEQNTNMEVIDDMTVEETIEHNKIKRAVSESLLEALEIANIKKNRSIDEDREEISLIVRQAVTDALNDPSCRCRYNIEPETHAIQHSALKGFMEFTEKLNGIKWKTVQALIVGAVLAAFSLMLFGAVVKIKLLSLLGIAH